MTLVLSMLVGMLSHPTLLLVFFSRFSLSREWMFDEHCLETGTSGGEAAGGRGSVVRGIEVKMPGREVA